MRYTLYTGDNCHQCTHVIQYLEKHQIEFELINLDHSDVKPPVQLYAFPALFEENDLVGYGTDIKEYIKKKSQTT